MKSGKRLASQAADWGNDDGHFVSLSPLLGSHSSQVTDFPFESSISALPSETRLMHVCRLNAGREGQICPYIITVLWLSLSPEVLMQIKWEALQTEPLQLPRCPALPSQSLILIVGSRGNFVCSLNALQVSQWPLHILSQIPILINCLQIIKLLRDNGTRLMYTAKARSPPLSLGWWSNLLWYPRVIKLIGISGQCNKSFLHKNPLIFRQAVHLSFRCNKG